MAKWIARLRVEWQHKINLTAAHITNPPLPALWCLHVGCPEGKPAENMLIQCTPLLVEKAGVAMDVTLTWKQVTMQIREPS